LEASCVPFTIVLTKVLTHVVEVRAEPFVLQFPSPCINDPVAGWNRTEGGFQPRLASNAVAFADLSEGGLAVLRALRSCGEKASAHIGSGDVRGSVNFEWWFRRDTSSMQSSHPEHFSALSAVQAAEVQAEKTALFWYCCRFMCGEESAA
jgi:hypothetical protein